MKLALLAGTHSGCGKTTVMLALLQYFCQQQRSVLAFKSGPDFLDPLWHQVVTGRPSYNLDTQMIGAEHSRQILAEQCRQMSWALIEGVMGLFDGCAGVGKTGSSADLAKVLDTPVILVVDVNGMSGSIVPLVSGFYDYADQMGIKIAGLIANKVGSSHHAELLKKLIIEYGLPPLLAWMTKEAPVLAERHLGLKRPDEVAVPDFQSCFHVDEATLLSAFCECNGRAAIAQTQQSPLSDKTIAVARDAACCFIYPANIDWLWAQGANVRYFSVLAGESVPRAADALWLPGGYPELYAQTLSLSRSWQSVKQFIEDDKPVLAECGGAMLLGQQIINSDGSRWPMAGILPFDSRMQKKLVSLGYRQEINGARGHEFHHSVRETEQLLEPAFSCQQGDQGVRYKNLRASYIHWYFASAPNIVAGWLS